MTRSDSWPALQDRTLKNEWRNGIPLDEIGRMLVKLGPWRSPETIRKRAQKLGAFRPAWFRQDAIRRCANRTGQSELSR